MVLLKLRLVTFKVHTEERLGVYVNDLVVDLNSAYALYLTEIEHRVAARRWASALIPPSMKEFLAGGNESLEAAQKTLDFIKRQEKNVVGLDREKIFLSEQDVRLCAPVPTPGKVYCLAVNFYDHATERIKDPQEKRN